MAVNTRVVRALVLSLAVGAGLAWATDQGGSGRTLLSQVRNAIGSLSTPWLVIPFLAGAICLRPRAGALVGLGSTMAALCGWYVTATLLEDLGGHGFLGDLRLEFRANQVYFVAGLLTGPLLGALGAWWHSRRRLPAAVLAGALLMCEPLVMAVLTALHHSGLLRYGSGLPSVVGVASNTAVTSTLAAWVLVGEFALGAVIVTRTLRASDR
jgi:hypothetical protein